MISNKPTLLGDLKELKVAANGVDISEAVSSVDIWQDIYTPTWTAAIHINDTTNLIHRLPLRQGAKVAVTLNTEMLNSFDESKTFEFVLYKITDHEIVKSRHMTYILACVHEHMLKNPTVRIQKYMHSNPDSIAAYAIQQLGGTCQGAGCENKVEMIIPNWSPFTIAQWCCKVGIKAGAADLMFYMTDNNRYRLQSLESMYNDSTGVKLIQRIADMRGEDDNIPADRYLAINSFSIEHFDALTNMMTGYYGNTTVGYDFYQKLWEEKTFKFGDDTGADNAGKSWGGDLFSDTAKSNVVFLPRHKENVFKKSSDDNVYKKTESDTWCSSRRSSFMKADQGRLFVQIPGGVKLWRYIGKSVEVDLPSHEDITAELSDKYYNGTYLVAAIHHSITGGKYSSNLELVKKRLTRSM